MKYNYKIRKNNEFKLIISDNSFTDSTTRLLKEKYNYILRAMKYENYKTEYDNFDILQEIMDGEKVVGFVSLIHIESIERILCINEVYILPEHRNKGLFYQCLLNLLSQPNLHISLRNPNRRIIDLLIQYNFAQKLKNNLVISYVDFYCDFSKHYNNKHTKEYYKIYEKTEQREMIKSNFYDLNINSAVFFDEENLIVFRENPAYIEKARFTDIDDKYFSKLSNVDLTYINVLYECFLKSNNILNRLSNQIEDYINQNLNIDDILGNEMKLSPVFIEFLDQYRLSMKDGQIIREKVFKALKNNDIIPKSIILRTMYLMNHINKKDTEMGDYIEESNDLKKKCPYCNSVNYFFLEVCDECGYNLQKNNCFKKNLPQAINKEFLVYEFITSSVLQEANYSSHYGLNKYILRELDDVSYDKDEIYDIQCKISTYQLLKNIKDSVYFDIYDYDSLNGLMTGTTLNYAQKHVLIEDLKDYSSYYNIMKIFFSDNDLRDILKRNNLNSFGDREELIFRIECELSPKDIFGKKYSLTKKGFEYLNLHEKYDYYDDNLYDFLFYDVYKFKKRYNGKDFKKYFVKYMLNDAINSGNYFKYHRYISYKINQIEEFSDNFLMLFTVLFIIDVNYYLNQKDMVQKPLSDKVMRYYPNIKEFIENGNIREIFNRALNYIKIEYLKENKELILFYLIKSLNYDDIEDVNREIEEEKYNKLFLENLLN